MDELLLKMTLNKNYNNNYNFITKPVSYVVDDVVDISSSSLTSCETVLPSGVNE